MSIDRAKLKKDIAWIIGREYHKFNGKDDVETLISYNKPDLVFKGRAEHQAEQVLLMLEETKIIKQEKKNERNNQHRA